MKNLLILIVAVALFLHFYPQKELQDFYEQGKQKVLETFSEATDTRVRLDPKKISRDLEVHFNQFKESERHFINELTQSRKNVVEFYRNYCQSSKRSAELHITNQKLVCDAITPYQSLF